MKFDQKKLIGSVQATGLAVAGFAGAHALSKLAPAKVSKFVPWGMLAAGVVLPAVVNNAAIGSLATGLGSYGALQTVNGFIAGEAGTEPTGVKAMIAKYVPQLSGTPGGLGRLGYPSLGRTYEYNEDTVPLLGTPSVSSPSASLGEPEVQPLI